MSSIILIDSPAHLLPAPANLPLISQLIHIPLPSLDDVPTPWGAPAFFKGELPFGGHAAATLTRLEHTCSQAVALCCYSLGATSSPSGPSCPARASVPQPASQDPSGIPIGWTGSQLIPAILLGAQRFSAWAPKRLEALALSCAS